MKTFKKIWDGFLSNIGTTLGGAFVAILLLLPQTAFSLVHLKPDVVFAIKLFAGYLAIAIIAAVGWVLYFKTRSKLKLKQSDLASAIKSPPRLQDDFVFDERNGIYSHKTKEGKFCAGCLHNNIESRMQVLDTGWKCLVDSKHFVGNRDYVVHSTPLMTWGRERLD